MVNQVHRYDGQLAKKHLKRAHSRLIRRLSRNIDTMEDVPSRMIKGWWY